MSGLSKTLEGFAARFKKLRALQPSQHTSATFEFISNRSAHTRVLQALNDVASRNQNPDDPDEVALLRRYLALGDADLEAEFCSAFVVDTTAPSLLPLMADFEHDVASYLPGSDPEAVLKLKEAITKRATTLDKSTITRADVLVALGTTEDAFLPALSRLLTPATVFSRAQYAELAEKISEAPQPVIVHASGGVGKSVFAQQLGNYLPHGSVKLTYDCYGLGAYRKSSELRHEHRQGLVQMANELATLGLCQPLFQSARATASDYSRAFLARVGTAANLLAKTTSSGLLVLVVDAADNAVMAADDFNSGRPFPVDLLREDLPPNVRLVMLCRTERIHLLNPPSTTIKLPISGLNEEESKSHLELKFGPAPAVDAQEFHKRTSGNPRVQAQVLSDAQTIADSLSILGERYLSPESAFEDLLDKWFAHIRDDAGQDAGTLDLMSQVLATLRPRIPTSVIAALSGASVPLVASFVSDIGRPLLLLGDAVQFRDEPTETWFRNNFRATGEALTSLVAGLRLLAEKNAYAATSLPQLLWEAGSFEELVNLALSEEALPNSNDIERQEIQQQRVQFALKAALRTERALEAARLALKAGTLAAGHSRRLKLIRENTDLAGAFLDPQTIEDLVASRSLGSGWPGSNLAYEGALMSVSESSRLDARNRLRSAFEWMSGWSRLPSDRQRDHRIGHEDIAELAMGRLNVDGPEACAEFLSRWRPPTIAFDVGTLVADRLIARGELVRLNDLLKASGSSKYLQLAITAQAARQNALLDRDASLVVMKTLRHHRNKIELSQKSRWDQEEDGLAAICGAIATCLRHGLISKDRASAILSKYLPADPPRALGSRFHQSSDLTLKAWAMRTYLTGEALTDAHLADPELLKELEGKNHVSTQEGRGYRQNIAPLIPWMMAWARVSCDPGADANAELQQLLRTLPKPQRRDDEEPKVFLNVAAKLSAWLLGLSTNSAGSHKTLQTWYESVATELWWPTTNAVIRLMASIPEMDQVAFSLGHSAHEQIAATREDAQDRTDALIQLTRALHSISPEESQHYFDAALALADKAGDEIRDRWDAMLAVVHHAGPGGDDDERAYKVAQLAEAVEPYMGDGFGYQETIKAVAALSARSSIAIASRWRDRRFGVFSEVIRGLLDPEAGGMKQAPLPSLAFGPFHDRITVSPLVERAVLSEKESTDTILGVAFDLCRMRGNRPEQNEQLVAAAKRNGFPCGEYEAPNAQSPSVNASRDWFGGTLKDKATFESVEDSLASLDFTLAADMDAGRQILRSVPYDQRHALLRMAFKQPRRNWSKIAKAFSETTGFSISDYESFFEFAAQLESLPAGFRNACGDLARHATVRFSEEIATRRWQELPWESIESVAGLASPVLLNLAFKELGSRGDFLDSSACFALLAKLVRQLSKEDSRLVLDDAIDHIQYLVEPQTADGPWTEGLTPPTPFSECIAGYVWAALGDPDEDMRWRAAHVVRMLCELQAHSELTALAKFAVSGQAGAFVDKGLVFYADDALLWLVMALDRAATTDARQVMDFVPLLSYIVESERPHILIRDRVDAIVKKVHAEQLPALGVQDRQRLDPTGTLRPEPLVLEYHERTRSKRSRYEKNDVGYDFDFDFRDYWIAPLADCFGLDALDIEQKTAAVIREQWEGQFQGTFEEDERWMRKIFSPGETHTYKGERPKIRDLNSYLSFHSLFEVAGELATSRPAYQDPSSDRDEFLLWLEPSTMTRTDGRWLSDRRDPEPKMAGPDFPTTDNPIWRWNVAPSDFVRHFTPDESGLFTVWEDSSRENSRRRQEVTVRTALVDPSHSFALMAALQTASSPHDFRIPAAGDELEIDMAGYMLRGWIEVDSGRNGIDEGDPFGSGMRYPPPRPSAQVQKVLNLKPDPDMRFWLPSAARSEPVFGVSAWDDLHPQGHGRSVGSQGVRVQIRPESLDVVLDELKTDLIAEVTIDRKTFDYSGRRTDVVEQGMGYLDEYFKIFVYRPRFGWAELRPNSRAW
ncbi:hypothetical protein [Pseudarthrobacter albicanus]|uniref:hypothetical protein n=1 Tax=Pseudarthrobacter albicanus TaxID=2823873 RepID=UPI001BAD1ADE|nr:hypothetical protein [Pseudarthrobacter albicanus]